MKIAKKLMMCGLVAVLSMGVVGCTSEDKAEATEAPAATATPEASTEAPVDPEAPVELTEEEKAVVVAIVDGVEITQGELDETYGQHQMEAMMQGMQPATKPEFLDRLVGDKVLIKKAEELIEVTDADIEKVYADLITQYGEEQVAQVIEQQGYTAETYKDEVIRQNESVMKLIEQMQAGDVTVTEEEIKKFYDDNTAQYFTQPAGGDMEHILVVSSPEATEEQKKKAEDAIKQIEKEFADGKTFEELKTKYTAEDIDKELYIVEDLGFVPYEHPSFDPLFLEGAKPVKEGEVSKAVKSSFGTHFIKVSNINPEEKLIPLEEVKETIVMALENEKKMANAEAKLVEYKKEFKIEMFEDRIK